MNRFFHWYQMAEAPEVYTAPARATGISACVPTPKLCPIISHGPNRRRPRKYSPVRQTRRPAATPIAVMTTK